jgi:hypothetical protein
MKKAFGGFVAGEDGLKAAGEVAGLLLPERIAFLVVVVVVVVVVAVVVVVCVVVHEQHQRMQAVVLGYVIFRCLYASILQA